MRLTPFKQGRIDGRKRTMRKTLGSNPRFTGRNRKAYESGYRKAEAAVIRAEELLDSQV